MRRCSAPARRSRAPYRGIRRQNQCYMGLSAPSVTPAIEPEMGFSAGLTDASAAYCPLFLRTWSQAALILERFSFRHARMVKSPWSMTGRQNFCTSRVQAFCSSAVPPRCCWRMLRRERDRQQGEGEEKFTHRIPSFRQQETLFPDLRFDMPERICLDGWRRVTQRRTQDKHGKCGQIYGDLSTSK